MGTRGICASRTTSAPYIPAVTIGRARRLPAVAPRRQGRHSRPAASHVGPKLYEPAADPALEAARRRLAAAVDALGAMRPALRAAERECRQAEAEFRTTQAAVARRTLGGRVAGSVADLVDRLTSRPVQRSRFIDLLTHRYIRGDRTNAEIAAAWGVSRSVAGAATDQLLRALARNFYAVRPEVEALCAKHPQVTELIAAARRRHPRLF